MCYVGQIMRLNPNLGQNKIISGPDRNQFVLAMACLWQTGAERPSTIIPCIMPDTSHSCSAVGRAAFSCHNEYLMLVYVFLFVVYVMCHSIAYLGTQVRVI